MIRRPQALVTACALLLLGMCLFTPAATYGQTPASDQDRRVALVKTAIERAGIRVLGGRFGTIAGYFGGGGESGPYWGFDTEFVHVRPSANDLLGQFVTVVSAMHEVLANEPTVTIFGVGHIWTKYGIYGQVRRGDVTTLINALPSARSQQDRDTALRQFYHAARWRVYDLYSQQWVDTADFVNKNFTSAQTQPSAPNPPSPPPPAPSAPSVKVLTLAAESGTSVGPGEHVLFKIGVGLSAPSSIPVEFTLGWRGQDGQFTYGQLTPITSTATEYTLSGFCLRVLPKRGSPPPPPGSGGFVRLEVHAALRVGSQVLISQPPVIVEARGQAPVPNPPPPTPARTPAPSSCKLVLSTE
jgi:hypothetical protein